MAVGLSVNAGALLLCCVRRQCRRWWQSG